MRSAECPILFVLRQVNNCRTNVVDSEIACDVSESGLWIILVSRRQNHRNPRVCSSLPVVTEFSVSGRKCSLRDCCQLLRSASGRGRLFHTSDRQEAILRCLVDVCTLGIGPVSK